MKSDWDQCDTSHITIICYFPYQIGTLSLTFSTDAYAVSLVVSLICFAEIAKLYHKIGLYPTLQKKSSKRISPFHAVQVSDNSDAFSV